MSATSTSEYGAHVADVILRGAALGAQIGNAARSARIALQQQRLQERSLGLQEQQMQMEMATFPTKQRFMQAQAQLMTARSEIETATTVAQIAEANSKMQSVLLEQKLKGEAMLLRPEYRAPPQGS